MSRDEQRSLLAGTEIFAGLTERDLDGLAAIAVRRKYDAKALVLEKGDAALHLYVIAKGRLQALTTGPSGRQAALSIMGPGEVFGEVALFDGEARSASIRCLERCELLTIGKNDLYHFLERHPAAAINLLSVLARRLRRLSERVEDTANLELPARLAKQLTRLVERYGRHEADGWVIALKLSQQELGELVGASRESVNKQVRAWVADEVLGQRGGRIVVRDRDALLALADG
ncbi:MAG: Crp/Fnr family transcriptional regulator [Myxococcota bacterium]